MDATDHHHEPVGVRRGVVGDREGLGYAAGAVTISFPARQWAVLRLSALIEREDHRARGVARSGALERRGRIG